ncbi:MAG: DUF2191 domain-containing protein [Deltaproteobacteria bacterium]|nr:MAG: DUF2191 domain-containing protein [Deltaproteobacteria bacterium]
MRTTITLDDDVARKLKEEMRRSGRTFKETVNETLRAGLARARKPPAKARLGAPARSLGLRPGLDYDRIAELLQHIEGPLGR